MFGEVVNFEITNFLKKKTKALFSQNLLPHNTGTILWNAEPTFSRHLLGKNLLKSDNLHFMNNKQPANFMPIQILEKTPYADK